VTRSLKPPSAFLRTCERNGVRLTREILLVSVARQRLLLCSKAGKGTRIARFECEGEFVVSTSRFGIGQIKDSNCTPLGLHRIAKKIGAGWPVGTVFESRRAVGFTWAGRPDAAIAHRILWLEGLEPGHNRGGNVDTFDRYIYIHGIGDESTLDHPAARGGIHMAAADLIPLYDRLPVGTLVWIGES